MPEATTRIRASPGPGSRSGIFPTARTSRAGPCLSYQAAFIGRLLLLLSGSGSETGGLSPRRRAQPLHVPHGRLAEQPLVLAAELRGVVVAHPQAGAGGIQVLAQQEAPRLLEPELLLELQGAHRRDRLELVVKARDAHPHLPRQALDRERLV